MGTEIGLLINLHGNVFILAGFLSYSFSQASMFRSITSKHINQEHNLKIVCIISKFANIVSKVGT